MVPNRATHHICDKEHLSLRNINHKHDVFQSTSSTFGIEVITGFTPNLTAQSVMHCPMCYSSLPDKNQPILHSIRTRNVLVGLIQMSP